MKQKLPYLVSGFFLGIIFRSFLDFGWAGAGFLILLGLAFTAFKNFHIAILCLGLFLGVVRYEWKDTTSDILSFQNIITANEYYEGIIIDEPEERDTYARYRIELTEGKFPVLVTTRKEPRFGYGDFVKIEGKIKLVENYNEFNWQEYLAKDEIYFESAFPKLTLVEHGKGSWLRGRLLILKHSFLGVLGQLIPEPEASLAGGLDLGAKQSLGKDLLDKFRIAGLIHMVVLSGYNITIVALGVMWLFKKILSTRASIGLGVVAIILFALMTGGSSTVLRASVMAILGLFAQATGRVSLVTRALVIAALIMVVINPKVLVFDIGFQLSFLATLGLIYLEPILRPYFKRLPEKFLWMDFRPIASVTIAAQLAVFPLILYTFGNFSLYAFPVNMLVLPVVPSTMLLVFLVGITGLFASFVPPLFFLVHIFAWASYALLSYMISIVTFVSRLPLASLQFSHVPLGIVLLLYVALIFFVLKFHQKEQHLGVKHPSA